MISTGKAGQQGWKQAGDEAYFDEDTGDKGGDHEGTDLDEDEVVSFDEL